jgi:colicin import membrane protein
VKRLFPLWPVLVVLLPAVALAQDASALNTISRVTVKSGIVEITGTQKPSFSTFPMTDPPRLVVDISQAVFSGVPEAIDVTSGHVVAIKTASYGSNASAIARVVIGFDRDVEPDIQAVGNKLVVRSAPAPGGGVAVAAAAPAASPSAKLSDTPPASAPAQDAAAAASAQATAGAAEKQRQDAAAAAGAQKQRQDAAAAAAAEQQRRDASAAAAAEKQRQDAATAAAAVAEKQRQDAAAAAAAAAEKQRLDAAAAAAAAEDKRRHEDAAAAAAAEEKRRHEAAAAAAAEERRQKDEVAAARTREERQQAASAAAAAEEKRKQEALLAAAAAENQRKQEAEATAAAAEQRRRQDGAAAAVVEQSRQQEAAAGAESRRQQDTKLASAAEARGRQDLLVVAPKTQAAPGAGKRPAPAAAESVNIEGAGSAGGTEANSRRKALTFVGFDEKGPRVYVRTNGPVRYSVSTGAKNTVVVELDNTSIPLHNNSRALDTAFFAGPVLRIQPERGPKNSVRVAITLRDGVAYQAHQDGNEVSVQFRAP